MTKTNNKLSILPYVSVKAVNKIKDLLKDEKSRSFIRIYVESGGCSGLSYKFSVDNNSSQIEDIIIFKDKERLLLVTDKISLDFIKDSKIDWQETLTGSQFHIDNPMAKSSCGCGSSFSI